jgi:hypothetical protein
VGKLSGNSLNVILVKITVNYWKYPFGEIIGKVACLNIAFNPTDQCQEVIYLLQIVTKKIIKLLLWHRNLFFFMLGVE